MDNFILYVIMCIFLIILPGPDTAIVTKNTVVSGRSGGFKTMFGTCTALLIHTFAAALGLSALLVKSAVLFSIVKYVGAVYLIYLGVRALWSIKGSVMAATDEVEMPRAKGNFFRHGFLTNLLNPKVAVFFLTFLPQFLEPSYNAFIQFSIMGITYIVLTIIWFILYIYLLNLVRSFMKKPSTGRILQGVTGTVLIGFGIKLAFEKPN